MSLLALLAVATVLGPRPAPPVYVTGNYALTFRTPKDATYCPLPEGWVGSDHGTVLFLVPPERCAGGAGYPSSGRGFSPGNVPRIEVYYGYWDPGDGPYPDCPNPIGMTQMAGVARPLCRSEENGELLISVRAPYRSDGPALVDVTLVTTAQRLDGDLAALRAFAATVQPCLISYRFKGQRRTMGSGSPCPAGKWF